MSDAGACPKMGGGFKVALARALKLIGDKVLKGNSLAVVIATYAIGALLLKYFIDWSSIDRKIVKKVNFFPIKDPKLRRKLEYWRGDNYGLDTHDLNGKPLPKSKCVGERSTYFLMTGWACLHVLLYVILGFLAPQCWWLMLAVTVGWEMFEFSGPRDYHDMLDVGWNTMGLGLGIALRTLLLPINK